MILVGDLTSMRYMAKTVYISKGQPILHELAFGIELAQSQILRILGVGRCKSCSFASIGSLDCTAS